MCLAARPWCLAAKQSWGTLPGPRTKRNLPDGRGLFKWTFKNIGTNLNRFLDICVRCRRIAGLKDRNFGGGVYDESEST